MVIVDRYRDPNGINQLNIYQTNTGGFQGPTEWVSEVALSYWEALMRNNCLPNWKSEDSELQQL